MDIHSSRIVKIQVFRQAIQSIDHVQAGASVKIKAAVVGVVIVYSSTYACRTSFKRMRLGSIPRCGSLASSAFCSLRIQGCHTVSRPLQMRRTLTPPILAGSLRIYPANSWVGGGKFVQVKAQLFGQVSLEPGSHRRPQVKIVNRALAGQAMATGMPCTSDKRKPPYSSGWICR